MKILFSGYHNPRYPTITEYIERALASEGHEVVPFDDRAFLLPARLRNIFAPLQKYDLRRLNYNFAALAAKSRPDVCIVTGGHRILRDTVERIRRGGTKTVLWTIDVPSDFDPIAAAAPSYDRVFCGGTEAAELLHARGVKNAAWLPFACSSEIGSTKSPVEKIPCAENFDAVFVGTVDPVLYPRRVKLLEAISGFRLGIWGPGAAGIPAASPLAGHIRGQSALPEFWAPLYSSAKICLCIHYRDTEGKIPSNQASPRVYEIMACGGFLLCDRQPDAAALFSDGGHLAFFDDEKDLVEKMKYYLARPDERRRIAKAGRDFVMAKHTYEHRVREIIKSVSQ